MGRNVRENRRLNEKSAFRSVHHSAARYQPAFLLPSLDVVQNRFLRSLVYYRTQVVVGGRIAHRQRRYPLPQSFRKFLINGCFNDGAGTG